MLQILACFGNHMVGDDRISHNGDFLAWDAAILQIFGDAIRDGDDFISHRIKPSLKGWKNGFGPEGIGLPVSCGGVVFAENESERDA